MRLTSSTRDLPWELWVLSAIAMIVPAGLFIAAAISYGSAGFIDRRHHTLFSEDTIWLLLLLGLPLVAQAISMLSLLRKALQDKAVNRFYRLCLTTTGIGSFGYCLLWLLYTHGLHDQWVWSIVALALIVVLVGVVGFVTFLIMWSPKPLPPARLTEEDIHAGKGSLCSKLYMAKVNDAPDHLVKVFDALGNAGLIKVDDVKINVADAASRSQFESVNVSAIVKYLNEQVIEKDFFQAKDIEEIDAPPDAKHLWYQLHDGQLEMTTAERKRLSKVVNRLLVEGCFDGAISPFLGTIRPSKWSVLFRELKAGLTKAPFGALIFFFTVFLVISFLFGFSFAFDDKAYFKSSGRPALFMARTHSSGGVNELTNADGNSPDGSANSVLTNPAPWPAYWFYADQHGSCSVSEFKSFDLKGFEQLLERKRDSERANKMLEAQAQSYRSQLIGAFGKIPKTLPRTANKDLQNAHVQLHEMNQSLDGNRATLESLQDEIDKRIDAWKSSRNHAHLSRIAQAIQDEAGQKREVLLGLMVGPKGTSDKDSVENGRKTSNLSTSSVGEEETKRRIRYLLTEVLSDKSAMPHNVEWLDLPAEDNRHQAIRSDTESDLMDLPWESLIIKEPLASLRQQNLTLQAEIDRIDQIKSKLTLTDNAVLRDRLADVARVALKGKLMEEQQLYEDKLADSLTALQEVRQMIEARGGKVEVNNSFAVSLWPLRDKHSSIPLSLMDYMYFTIYTITTTGYGDIVPTTTYAKFLVSLANILEVFFLVVFFNALLSAKKQRER